MSEIFEKKPRHPGEVLREMLTDRGWTQDTLASITGRSRATISAIVSGRSGVTAEMAAVLAAALGNEISEWTQLNAGFEAWNARSLETSDIERRARLFTIAPIRDMQRRGWIRPTEDLSELESDLQSFFGTSLSEGISFPVSTRRTETLEHLNIAERTWCFRARQLAKVIPAGPFRRERMDALDRKLRRLAAYPKEAAKLSDALIENGIRFVIVEPLPSAKIDGAAFWLDEDSPVIAVSLRYDRIDSFWFTVMHEYAHIRNGDLLSTDTDLLHDDGTISVVLAEEEAERRANEAASNSLVPRSELDSFIRRVRPFYSADRIVQFANRIKMHPGVIVGQLQHRKEIGYSALREHLVKVRHAVTSTALTDGWGQQISPGVL